MTSGFVDEGELGHEEPSMDSILKRAMDQNLVVSFDYDTEEGVRFVIPTKYGELLTGEDAIEGYLVRGASKSKSEPRWRTYHLRNIDNLNITNESSTTPEGYKRVEKHKRWKTLFRII